MNFMQVFFTWIFTWTKSLASCFCLLFACDSHQRERTCINFTFNTLKRTFNRREKTNYQPGVTTNCYILSVKFRSSHLPSHFVTWKLHTNGHLTKTLTKITKTLMSFKIGFKTLSLRCLWVNLTINFRQNFSVQSDESKEGG